MHPEQLRIGAERAFDERAVIEVDGAALARAADHCSPQDGARRRPVGKDPSVVQRAEHAQPFAARHEEAETALHGLDVGLVPTHADHGYRRRRNRLQPIAKFVVESPHERCRLP